MSNKPEVERAAEVLRSKSKCSCKSCDELAYCPERHAEQLSAANLLRTAADERNAELAAAMLQYNAEHNLNSYRPYLSADGPSRDRVWAALRAILDAENPVERWAVGNGGDGLLYTVFEVGHPTNGVVAAFASRANAEAYAASLNAEERAK